mmetsp:Transcript_14087/g.19790  ORF Transcript_14087/g.19790 Transcript_14087/m.19790 type:complete len:114 (+) Transcript_14087:182-523(+)
MKLSSGQEHSGKEEGISSIVGGRIGAVDGEAVREGVGNRAGAGVGEGLGLGDKVTIGLGTGVGVGVGAGVLVGLGSNVVEGPALLHFGTQVSITQKNVFCFTTTDPLTNIGLS